MNLPAPPPTQPPGSPPIDILLAGTRLFRVHRLTHPADSFNPTAAPSALAGGRFDSLDGTYAYTYLGHEPGAAIAETLTRALPPGGAPRIVPRSELVGRAISTVEITRDLPVLALHGAALGHVGATLDLTKSPAQEYLTTRAWARSLRQWLPHIAGLRYRCRHNEDLYAVVLFDDGPPPEPPRARGALRVLPGATVALDEPDGESLVVDVLHAHNATVLGPTPRQPWGQDHG